MLLGSERENDKLASEREGRADERVEGVVGMEEAE